MNTTVNPKDLVLQDSDQTRFENLQKLVRAGELENLTYKDKMDYYAMRCVRDFNGPQGQLENAVAWIEYAYRAGKQAGEGENENKWKKRIGKLFDL